MKKRFYIELSNNDTALVSYFPGFELRDHPESEWITDVLVPAVETIAKRKSKTIRTMPVTFRVDVRKSARRGAEIFLFVTPAYPGKLIEEAMNWALAPLINGNVNAGREPLPATAIPCLQIFRGKLIRFYQEAHESQENPSYVFPTITWKDGFPAIGIVPVTESEVFYEEDSFENAVVVSAEARIVELTNGNEYRKFQQILLGFALNFKEKHNMEQAETKERIGI